MPSLPNDAAAALAALMRIFHGLADPPAELAPWLELWPRLP